MNIPKYIKTANKILRELDSILPGFTPPEGKYKLCWSEDLFSLVPEYFNTMDDAGEVVSKPVMKYICHCGVDKAVHEPDCNGYTLAKVKLQRVSTFGLGGEYPQCKNVWALCTWVAPPSEADWIDSMGTDEDYPANGRYIPVHRGQFCVVIPPKASQEEYILSAKLFVTRFSQHTVEWKKEIEENTSRGRMTRFPIYDARGNMIKDADSRSPYHRVVDRLKEKMIRFNPDGTVGYTKAIKETSNVTTD